MPRPTSSPSTALVPPAEEPRARLLRLIEEDLAGTGLERWQEQFGKWLALQGRVSKARQIEVASLLAGTTVTSQEIVALRCRPAFKALWIAERDVPRALDKAKADFSALIEESATHYKAMLDLAVKDRDVRAATGLLTPLLDRAMPRKEEGPKAAPDVHIHLSVQQAKGLESTPLDVTAEEVVTVEDYTVES